MSRDFVKYLFVDIFHGILDSGKGFFVSLNSIKSYLRLLLIFSLLKLLAWNIICIGIFAFFEYFCNYLNTQPNGTVYDGYNFLTIFATGCKIIPYAFIRIFSVLWHSDISNAALRYLNATQTNSRVIFKSADFLYSIIIEIVFGLQIVLIYYLPAVINIPVFIHCCLLNALYCFEYSWMSADIKCSERVEKIHKSWPYFIGFGLLLTSPTLYVQSSIVNNCIFAALFPFFIISGYLSNDKAPIRSAICRIPFFKYTTQFTDKALSYVPILTKTLY
uniref:Etoposide-induced protein 2.4 n=1 Tax=Rhabditophanes sp. KR3021 TaxID=114890 RepID=A0AC35TU27_9BILA